MTEAGWFACEDPRALLDFLRDERGESRRKIGRRRLRLFACACARGVWHLLRHSGSREALEVAERYADGLATGREVAAAIHRAKEAVHAEYPGFVALSRAHGEAAQAAGHAVAKRYGYNEAPSVAHAAHAASLAWALNESDSRDEHQWRRQAVHAAWLRDVFGNPFRPVAFAPEWRTDTAVLLAQQMYESREFGAMPILADALQDAGCDSDEVLTHLRDSNATHVRGCWVTDLVLDRS